MIEVEKKFALEPGDRERLTKGRTPFVTITMVDTYYDDRSYSLSVKNAWLRKRNDRFELKVAIPLDGSVSNTYDQFKEIEDDEGIRTYLGITRHGIIDKDITDAGFTPFGTITTIRNKYRIGGMIVDVDNVDNEYELVEIELMVEQERDMSEALKKITTFAESIGLAQKAVRGKVFELIRKTKPQHYKALVDAGVIRG